GELGALPGGFLYPGERPRRWKDTRDLWVHGYWAWDWANSYEKVVELDLARHRIRTAPPHGLYGFRPGQRFYFLNVLEELDRPGEWFLDRDAAILYFWPPAPGAREALLSRLGGPLLRLQDAAHLTFRGLLLEATRGSGVEIQGGTSNQVVSCVLRNLGNLGVVIEGGVGHQVRASEILDTGDGGVAVTGGHRDTLAPGGHVVENCHFQRQARWSRCYAPAIQLSGVGLSARHNLIHDHPHAGIIFWGNDHQIEFNEIHHIALETGDVGAIYTGRDYTFRGNRIRHNFIHDTGGVGMGSMGVYLDDCVSGTEVSGNVFWRVHWAMFIGGGRDHRVENNVFIDCDPAVRVDARGLDPAPVWRNMVDETMRQRLAEVPPALYRERYPELRSLDAVYGPPGGPAITGSAFRGVPASGNVIAHNVCLGRWLEAAWHAREGDLDLLDNRVDPDPAGAPGSRLQKGLQRAAGRRG
ncbi:MAG: right-handed parallel beta-helix repeat-containing protein, partial [Verrucomicrobiota bacterium]